MWREKLLYILLFLKNHRIFLEREKVIQLLFVQLYTNTSYFNFAPDEAQGKDAQWPRFPLTFFSVFCGLDFTWLFKARPGHKQVKDSPSRALCTAPAPVFTSYSSKWERKWDKMASIKLKIAFQIQEYASWWFHWSKSKLFHWPQHTFFYLHLVQPWTPASVSPK